MKKLIFIVSLVAFGFSYTSLTFAQFSEWKEFAPFYAESIQSLAKHPSGRIFASTRGHGLYYSNDHGKSWEQSYYYHTNLITGAVGNLAIDSRGNIFMDAVSRGLMHSNDGGKTWNLCEFPNYSEGIFSITTDKDDRLLVGTKNGIYVSEDHGKNWMRIFDSSDYYIVRNICVKDDIYYALVDQTGLFKSKDHGQTWTRLSIPWSYYYWSMVVLNENEILVAFSTPFIDSMAGMMKTLDGGKSWNPIESGLSTKFISVIAANEDNILYAGGNNATIFKSFDCGQNWEQLTCGESSRAINSFLLDGDVLLAGSSAGILRSEANSNSWKFSNTGFNCIRADYLVKVDNNKFLIANNAGIYEYNSLEEKYRGLNIFHDIPGNNGNYDFGISSISGIISLGNNSFIISTYQGIFLKSTDNGNNWDRIDTYYNPTLVPFVKRNENGIIYYSSFGGDRGLFRSSDNGISWDIINREFAFCRSMLYDQQGNLWTGNLKWLYKTENDSSQWDLVGDFGSQILNIAKSMEGTLYVLTEHTGLFRSCDNGLTWSNTKLTNVGNGNTTNTSFCYKIVEPVRGHFLVGTGNGLYESIDNGLSWTKREDKIKDDRIFDFFFDSKNSILYSMTDSGLYYSTISITTDIPFREIPKSYVIYQNYPNPFNPTTKITYQLPEKGNVVLKIYDALGKEIRTLVNSTKEAGYYSIDFDASDLPSGVYIYQIQAGKFSQSKKMLLVK